MTSRIAIFLLLTFLTTCATAARLQSIQVKQQGGKTSLFFTLDTAIAHKVFTLTNPDRVVVDFEDTSLAFNLHTLNLDSQLIKLVRSGRPNAHTLRLVFEVRNAVKLRANPWNRAYGARHAFSLDMSANGRYPNAITKPIRPIEYQPVATHHAPRIPRSIVVVLDPGHGGKDPGAIGPRRSKEKNVTLTIALKLKQIIDRQPGMRAVLTRHGDYYVGLRERLTIARKYNGDVFISIHADAFKNQQSSGASVFALSQRGATSEAARWLAEKENYSELGGVNLKDLDDQSGLVREVLIDLSQTATIGASLHMGERVLRNMNTMTNLHNHKVEQARFMVLKSPDIPSVLVETGFISNPREERNLNDYRYQQRLTQAIFQGLKSYFQDYPPSGTHSVASVSNDKAHKVQWGETLQVIARHYHVPMASLMRANNLKNGQIRAGQRLVIPSS